MLNKLFRNYKPVCEGFRSNLRLDDDDFGPGIRRSGIDSVFNSDRYDIRDRDRKALDSGYKSQAVKDFEEGESKKVGKLDEISKQGLDKLAAGEKSEYKDEKSRDTKELLDKHFRDKSESSHDKGGGGIKTWNWDKASDKRESSGDVVKKSSDSADSNKAGHESLVKDIRKEHDDKAIIAGKGDEAYKKSIFDEGQKKEFKSESLDRNRDGSRWI